MVEHATSFRYQNVSTAASTPRLVREVGSPMPPPSRLLDRVRAALRARPFGRRMEKAYVAWTVLPSLIKRDLVRRLDTVRQPHARDAHVLGRAHPRRS